MAKTKKTTKTIYSKSGKEFNMAPWWSLMKTKKTIYSKSGMEFNMTPWWSQMKANLKKKVYIFHLTPIMLTADLEYIFFEDESEMYSLNSSSVKKMVKQLKQEVKDGL